MANHTRQFLDEAVKNRTQQGQQEQKDQKKTSKTNKNKKTAKPHPLTTLKI